VVDQNGNLLSDTRTAKGGKQLDPNQLKYVEALQQSIVKQVESMIAPIVGQNNVRAEATAEVDFAQVDTAAEMYKPNSPPEPQAIRSQQTSEQTGPGNQNPSGVPGALSNQPPGVATAPIDGAAAPGRPAATDHRPDQQERHHQLRSRQDPALRAEADGRHQAPDRGRGGQLPPQRGPEDRQGRASRSPPPKSRRSMSWSSRRWATTRRAATP
jgi:flagellar biosynthesis/type III secretory pathway M-ring protein FliF/YscJ